MFRFLLFVGVVWLVMQIIRLVFRSLAERSSEEKRGGRYGVGSNRPQPPPVEFKDVRDAEFKDITVNEKK